MNRAEYMRQWRRDNPEKAAESGRRYYEQNRERIAERTRLYYERNREHILERTRRYREAHAEEIRAASRRRYHADPEKAQRAHQRWHRQSRYGLTPEQYAAMYEAQDGTCAICTETKRLAVDHDHATGKVRALLCHRCNMALGVLESDPKWLATARAYLKQHQ